MTEQTQPTDAEILDAVKHLGAAMLSPVEVARAVLAKWGTPAGAGEVPGPVRLRFFRDMTEDQRLLVFKVFGVLPEGAESQADTHHVQGLLLKAMYRQLTSPQPTQAQAWAVPEEFLRSVIALCTQRGYSPENIEAWSKDDKWVADLWRQADEMLTIKGADHG